MPGLIGFTKNNSDITSKINIVEKMQDIITHLPFYTKDPIYDDELISASRTHINIIQKEIQPFEANNHLIWLDGEFYNQTELIKKYNLAAGNDPEIFHAIYGKEKSFSFLKDIDGIYVVVLYDRNNKKVYLINDRYGYRHLYWTVIGKELAWSSEIKAFAEHPAFKIEINKRSVDDFVNEGYLSGNGTWFENVELLPPASILSWDINTKTYELNNHWDWGKISLISEATDRREIIEELYRLFLQAVERRCSKKMVMGIELSGGLDSRAILAAYPEKYKPLHTVTFGKAGSSEKNIAAEAAKLKGSIHHEFEISDKNWIHPRLNGVWWTDGQKNLKHMHGIEVFDKIKKIYDVTMTGNHAIFIKGGYSNNNLNELDMLREKQNRHINMGARLRQFYIELRRPFLDNDLMFFTLSIPGQMRANMDIFNPMLLSKFETYFKKLSYEAYGLPISSPKVAIVFNRAIRGAKRRLYNRGICSNAVEGYTDYFQWTRNDPAKSLILSILNNKDAIYPEFVSREKVARDLKSHFYNKINRSEQICRYLTFEIWLQQIFENKFRPERNLRC